MAADEINKAMPETSPDAVSAQTAEAAQEKVRYSDEELQEFKEIILNMLKSAKEDYDSLRASVTNSNGVEDTSPTFKIMEEGASSLTKY